MTSASTSPASTASAPSSSPPAPSSARRSSTSSTASASRSTASKSACRRRSSWIAASTSRRRSRTGCHSLGRDFAIAIALVLLTLLPLGFRASLVVMVSIPASFAIGVIVAEAARLFAEPALHRRLRAGARPAGRRLHRRHREHLAPPAARTDARATRPSPASRRSTSRCWAARRRCCSPSCRCSTCRKAPATSRARCRWRWSAPSPRRCSWR